MGCVVIRATGGGEERGGATSRGGCGGGPRGLKDSAKPCLAAVWGAGGSTVDVRACEDSVCTGTWRAGGAGSADPGGAVSRLTGGDGRIRLSGCFTGAALGLSSAAGTGVPVGVPRRENLGLLAISLRSCSSPALVSRWASMTNRSCSAARSRSSWRSRARVLSRLSSLSRRTLTRRTLIACIQLGEHSRHHTK